LGAADRQAASELMPLVAAEVEALDSGELVSRIERLASDNSDEPVATKYAYLMAARQRRRSILETRARQTDQSQGYAGSSEATTPLDFPLQALSEQMFAEENKRRTAATRTERGAVEAALETCYLVRHNAKDMQQAVANQQSAYTQFPRTPAMVSSTGEIADDHTTGAEAPLEGATGNKE